MSDESHLDTANNAEYGASSPGISTIWGRLKSILNWLRELSIWYRLLLGAVLGTLGGSTFLGFLNTYAVYWYAYSYGCRVPVEGVPYLNLAVSMLSLALIASVLMSAYLVYGVLALIRHTFNTIDYSLILEGKSFTRTMLGVVPYLLLLTMLLGGWMLFTAGWWLPPTWTAVLVHTPNLRLMTAIMAIACGVSAAKRRWFQWYMVGVTLGMIALIAGQLFHPTDYARMLRAARYGGGVIITVTRGPEHQKTNLFLFLITSENLIAFDDTQGVFVEIPRKDVELMEYPIRKDFVLPHERIEGDASHAGAEL